MGVMNSLAPVEPTPIVLTPHPVTLEGQQFIPAELREGETLGAFLDRTIDLGADAWEVKVGGVVVPVEHWDRVKPKHGHLIEVRGAVRKQALYIVAMIALTYFTFGIGTAAGWGAGAAAGAFGGGLAGALFAGAVFAAGSILINKALGPKPPKMSAEDRESVYNLAGARNAVRPHEPLGLLFGSTRIAPDVISQPYTRYYGQDQYLHFVLTPGLNVDRFDDLYLGDTLLSSYDDVQVWTAGFPGMPEQGIPLYTNADTVAGGELDSSTWVERTTSPDTVEILINLEYMLGGVGTSGKKYYVDERVDVEYRPVGSGTWLTLASQPYRSNILEQRRATIARTVAKGQYDVRVRIAGLGNYTGDNTHFNDFTWSTLVSVQEDETDYRGIPRIGVKIKATGQLNGTPDQIRAVFHQKSMPVWGGSGWETATDRATGLSNPGALILAYARGYRDPDDNLVAGIGLPDSMIDIAALQAFMLHCASKGYTYDHWLQSPRSHAEVVDSIALAGFGQVTWAGGKLSVVWAGSSQPLSGVVNMATMKRGTFEVDYNLASAADGIEYTYFDRDTWQSATIRVPAPGVTTMLNPARLTGEGVTTEAHAAQLARYHLAQHLYQFKSIGFSTDLEHMSYRRLSKLALQHDMTKWGRGGRVMSAVNSGGTVTLTLDEPVAPPSAGASYIGLRIPGERVYRVFQVATFAEETDTITLVESWPAGVPLPGNSESNPAHDTVWIFDFKATPGYTVRVVSIEPESGLKGARVSVVPESPEFWTYVETGHYEPPVVPPIDQSRPIVSGLSVSENQIQIGRGEYTELSVTFDVSGHVGHCVVFAGLIDQPLEEVAQTQTRSARWRIEEPGTYAIVVRPFDIEGRMGTPASITYVTARAAAPPPVFDHFAVLELDGGVRKYVWGYNASTMQAANLAGAEIRYTAGDVPSPVWEDMTPLGDGYFTAAFEMILPPSGTWTFACRAVNTSGILSVDQFVLVKTLASNLDEILDNMEAERVADLLDISGRLDEANARIDAVLGAPPWDDESEWPEGAYVVHNGYLFQARQDVPANTEPPSPTYWLEIGEYDSVGEAVAAAVSISEQTATDLAAESLRIDGVVASVGTVDARVTSEESARISGDEANATAISQVALDLGDTQASVTTLSEVVGSGLDGGILNPSFEHDMGWGSSPNNNTLPASARYIRSGGTWVRSGTSSMGLLSGATVHNGRIMGAVGGDQFKLSAWVRTVSSNPAPSNGNARVGMRAYDADGAYISGSATSYAVVSGTGGNFSYQYGEAIYTVPAGAVGVSLYIGVNTHGGAGEFVLDDVRAEKITSTEQSLRARHTVALDVNGYIAGTVTENDGINSSFAIMADRFAIVPSSSTGERVHWSDGNFRIYDSSGTLRVRMGVW